MLTPPEELLRPSKGIDREGELIVEDAGKPATVSPRPWRAGPRQGGALR